MFFKRLIAGVVIGCIMMFSGIAADALNVPEYSNDPFVTINNNQPDFSDKEKKNKKTYESYGELDSLGRCTAAIACIGQDCMPTEDRKSISSVKPTGWQSSKYDFVDGKWLFQRCHLIGYQLTAENANKLNLITGTRYLNIDGMLPFENMVADYIKETNNHVLYRVVPIFEGDELVARGVTMEGYSVEDKGAGICFNVFCYNVQPGVTIDYATGKNALSGTPISVETNSTASANDAPAVQLSQTTKIVVIVIAGVLLVIIVIVMIKFPKVRKQILRLIFNRRI